jgi:hypothetical protein
MKEAVFYQNPATATKAYNAVRRCNFAHNNPSTAVSALPCLPSRISVHAAELIEQMEELRASKTAKTLIDCGATMIFVSRAYLT